VTFDLKLLESQFIHLKSSLLRGDGRERAALMLLGKSNVTLDPWTAQSCTHYLVREVQILADRDHLELEPDRVTIDNNHFVRLLKQADRYGLSVGLAHCHPEGLCEFSGVDDTGESGLFELVAHRNGSDSQLISILISGKGDIAGRVWTTLSHHEPVHSISILGNRFRFHSTARSSIGLEALQRQVLAFGPEFTQTLTRLSVGIVGCGGTGSAVATLLARLGVGRLLLIDHDYVEITNLNRLHGATMEDALCRRPKVDVVKRSIQAIGLGTAVATFRADVGSPSVVDGLKACDVIFGCTDDNLGRLLLNRLAYFYLIPVIDLGLALVLKKEGQAELESLDGRVTVLLPGNTCLLCRGVIQPELARAEHLRRTNPNEYERQKREAYVIDAGIPNPAVVTFTTEVATMAVNELLHRIHGFRGEEGSTAQRTRLFHRMQDLRQGDKPQNDCPICGRSLYWARGDIDPFLDRVQ
jgi:molybdopterin/thiamine biosynthesis adenylyltransferase